MKKAHEIRFRCGGATAKLVRLSPVNYALSNLYSRHRGRGDAKGVMQDVVDYADTHQFTIRLIAEPYGPPNLPCPDIPSLMAFYERFGFMENEGDNPPPYVMTRYPSQTARKGPSAAL